MYSTYIKLYESLITTHQSKLKMKLSTIFDLFRSIHFVQNVICVVKGDIIFFWPWKLVTNLVHAFHCIVRAVDFCIYTTKLGLIVDQFQLLTNDVLLWINAHFVFLKVSSFYYYRPKQTCLVKYRLLCFPDRKIEG